MGGIQGTNLAKGGELARVAGKRRREGRELMVDGREKGVWREKAEGEEPL